MAGAGGQTTDTITDRLAADPYAFDFFHAARILQACFPEKPRIGASVSAAQDPLRFSQPAEVAFSPSTLHSLSRDPATGIPRLRVNFFGLLGPNGPLPLHITEYIRDRERNSEDPTPGAFFNIFNHRLISFFFRAWAESRKTVDLDRSADADFPVFIGSLIGIGLEGLRNRDAVPDWSKLYFSGRLSSQTRNAEGLEAILESFFEINTEIQTFTGRWMDLPPDSICQLGVTPETGCLGQTAILGSKIWDCQLGFRVRLGPMSFADYERMLPGSPSFERLRSWIRNYCDEHYSWDAQYVLDKSEVPDTMLGRSGRLGWTTWLKTRPMPKDPDDLVITPHEA
jgi:type VI secretion system protein ImpH